MTLQAGEDAAEWVIFEAFNAGSECDELTIDFTGSGQAGYLLLANFSTGRWQVFSQLIPGNNSQSVGLDLPQYYSPLHRQYFAVLANPGGGIVINQVDMALEAMDPIDSLVSANVFAELEAIDCNGRPGIFYRDSAEHLLFALADNASPQDPVEWQHSTVVGDEIVTQIRATMHEGRPVVAYCGSASGEIWLVASETSLPTQDGNWDRVQVQDGSFWHSYCAVHSDKGVLQLAYTEADPLDVDTDSAYAYLGYARSITSDPLDGFTAVRIKSLGDVNGAEEAQPDICTFAGEPAIALANLHNASQDGLLYLHAQNDNPQPGEWDEMEFSSEVQPDQIWLDEIAGAPLIMWKGLNLVLQVADYPHPVSVFDWHSRVISTITADDHFSMARLNGRPSLCFTKGNGIVTQLIIYTSSPGGLPDDGQFGQEQVSFLTNFTLAPDCRIFQLGNRPAVAYVNLDDSTLHYVRLRND